MFPPLSSIREMRRKLGWTQKELAKRSGVSQSTIAKIEKGKLTPSYEVAVKIFRALYQEEGRKGIRAEDIMSTEIITAGVEETLASVSRKMRENDISQLPVVEDGKLVGMITERDIAEAVLKYGTDVGMLRVLEVMGPPPPTIRRDTNVRAVAELLKQYPAVIVEDDGNMVGIVSRADIVYLIPRM